MGTRYQRNAERQMGSDVLQACQMNKKGAISMLRSTVGD